MNFGCCFMLVHLRSKHANEKLLPFVALGPRGAKEIIARQGQFPLKCLDWGQTKREGSRLARLGFVASKPLPSGLTGS